MDPVAQVRFTRDLIDIDSTTGREHDAGAYIARLLRSLGYHTIEQPVVDGRFNVYAHLGDPWVVLSTHMDCVPPFIESREDHDFVYGRGACDAKGTILAQIAAAERLRSLGETRVGLLFVVGEERGSEGAKAANAIAPGSRFLIDGEPTDNRLGRGTRGAYRVRLTASGRAAHSSQPELGESAIDKLVDALVALRDVEWPADPLLGETFYTTGLIKGGIAPNVISPEAEAEIMFRTVGSHLDVRQRITERLGTLVSIADVLVVPPVHLTTVPGVDAAVFSFTTDIPFLDRWGAPLLIGPGSVTLAHTSGERVGITELHQAVDHYARLVTSLLSRSG